MGDSGDWEIREIREFEKFGRLGDSGDWEIREVREIGKFGGFGKLGDPGEWEIREFPGDSGRSGYSGVSGVPGNSEIRENGRFGDWARKDSYSNSRI